MGSKRNQLPSQLWVWQTKKEVWWQLYGKRVGIKVILSFVTLLDFSKVLQGQFFMLCTMDEPVEKIKKSNISDSPLLFRHQIQFPTVKEDRCSEIVLVSVSTRRAFDDLNFAVQTFGYTVRYSIHDCSQNSCPMAFQRFRCFPDRFQSGMGSPPEPFFSRSKKQIAIRPGKIFLRILIARLATFLLVISW